MMRATTVIMGVRVWWLALGVSLLVPGNEPAPPSSSSASSQKSHKREADYTLDDSFWNEDSPVGEVERLMREYRQNQELVRNIGAHYYQIIYPVQLRHHEKMGISTREVGQQRFPSRGQGTGSDPFRTSEGQRQRSRTGKHFHSTSLLIKAFNHKFRLDLELNTQLLAPNLIQKHFLPTGAEAVTKSSIEHCYYHGTVKDYPGATAAFHTCNGVSGVIHVGNETFVIHPFYGGDLSKHPHVIFEARTKANKGCGNTGTLEWRMNNRRQKHLGMTEDAPTGNVAQQRYRRDVREATKYIETALIIDKAMFEKRNGSSRGEIVHDAIQVANIADLYFRTLNTRVSVVYIETWQGTNQAQIDKNQDISRALLNFNDYTSRKLFKVDKDTTQLLTGETFQGGESGMAVPETVCTAKSVGISVDLNTYEPHLLAGTMAHMIGHNIGMGHDDGREECFCRDWHGCIMSKSIIGLENVQPYKFSECSRSDYIDALRIGHGICLLNKPNEVEVRRTCGNSIVEEGEDCDCGTIDECHDIDPCCDPITCKLTTGAECASGPCCNKCRLLSRGVICRDSSNECDLPEHCSGDSGQCPPDVHKKNGNPCGQEKGYCFTGVCPTLSLQCEQIWGVGAVASDKQCFEQFNSKGSLNGHCGKDETGALLKCDAENVRCGSLQCQLGARYPVISGMDELFSRTIFSLKSMEYECKSTSGSKSTAEIPEDGLVRDGTPCGENLICVNQTCTSIFPHIDQGRCPSNHNNLECSGHGVCTNVNKCFCDGGWASNDCSVQMEATPSTPSTTVASSSLVDNTTKSGEPVLTRNVTPYGTKNNNLSTIWMVVILVCVVKGVFVCFALMAVCYRRKSAMPRYEPPYAKNSSEATALANATAQRKLAVSKSNASARNPEEAAMESANKILSFGNVGNLPAAYSYNSRSDSARVLFRPPPAHRHMSPAMAARIQEGKLQQMKRMALQSASEDEPMHSGDEAETVSFIDLPPNNLSKQPEKGILKKHGGYGTVSGCEPGAKWSEDSQSDNQDIMSQSDNNLGGGGSTSGGGGSSNRRYGVGAASNDGVSEVERTLKSLNGYHEDLLVALRHAASSHRAGHATPSGSSSHSLLGEEMMPRKSLAECNAAYGELKRQSMEKLTDGPSMHTVMLEGSNSILHHRPPPRDDDDEDDDDDDDRVPPAIGPIRIRNLEDLIRQLETHSARHMSPSGSEDIRMSETEADRHYRIESHDPPGRRSRSEDDAARFVYGRYRHPSGRAPAHRPPMHSADDEALYETADLVRGRDPHDSESDEFIQAQQCLARSVSDEAIDITPNPSPAIASPPAGSSDDDDEPPPPPPPDDDDDDEEPGKEAAPTGTEETALLRPKRYPEYKH